MAVTVTSRATPAAIGKGKAGIISWLVSTQVTFQRKKKRIVKCFV
jgi:hypothetical protein